jgi:hypothetical protein
MSWQFIGSPVSLKTLAAASIALSFLGLADGNKQLWRVETGPPCGVGVATNTSYYLPLANGDLCTIDLTSGRISARTSSPNKERWGTS